MEREGRCVFFLGWCVFSCCLSFGRCFVGSPLEVATCPPCARLLGSDGAVDWHVACGVASRCASGDVAALASFCGFGSSAVFHFESRIFRRIRRTVRGDWFCRWKDQCFQVYVCSSFPKFPPQKKLNRKVEYLSLLSRCTHWPSWESLLSTAAVCMRLQVGVLFVSRWDTSVFKTVSERFNESVLF